MARSGSRRGPMRWLSIDHVLSQTIVDGHYVLSTERCHEMGPVTTAASRRRSHVADLSSNPTFCEEPRHAPDGIPVWGNSSGQLQQAERAGPLDRLQTTVDVELSADGLEMA